VENITQFCWKYSSSIQQRKNFENRLRFEKVIGKSLVASFLGHGVVATTVHVWNTSAISVQWVAYKSPCTVLCVAEKAGKSS